MEPKSRFFLRKENGFSPLIAPAFISGVMIGMISAYYLDPDRGRRRRALVRDRLIHFRKLLSKATSKKTHHWQNKIHGYQSRLLLH
jgi:hypothetical protein